MSWLFLDWSVWLLVFQKKLYFVVGVVGVVGVVDMNGASPN